MEGLGQRHNNNFDALRMIAALFVFYSHFFFILRKSEPMLLNSGEDIKITLGAFGVSIFFTISGYLITRSLLNTDSFVKFVIRRFARIYPGLIVNVFFVIFLLAPLISKYSLAQYFAQVFPNALSIFINMTVTFNLIDHSIPVLNDIFRGVVNGPLWSLPWEMACYGWVLCLALIAKLENRIFPITILILSVALLIMNFLYYPEGGKGFAAMLHACSFALGATFYNYRRIIPLKAVYFFAALLLFAVMVIFNICVVPLYLLLVAYLTMYIATANGWLSMVGKYGDFSYGTYIYSWPVTYAVAYCFIHNKITSLPLFFFISLFITLVLAALSWKLVEKPALMFVRK